MLNEPSAEILALPKGSGPSVVSCEKEAGPDMRGEST